MSNLALLRRMPPLLVSSCVAFTAALCAAAAHAEEVAPPPSVAPSQSAPAPLPPETPAAATPVQAGPAPSAPVATSDKAGTVGAGTIGGGRRLAISGFPEAPPPPPPTDAEPKAVYEDRTRLRGGAGLMLGSYSIREAALPVFGLEGRIGAQFSDAFGLYAAPGFFSGADPVSGAGFARMHLGVVPELVLVDSVFLALGPELQGVTGGEGLDASVRGALGVGGRFRGGVAFGRRLRDQRHAFTVAFDLRIDAFSGALGFSPALALGYDAY
jgi:hypothetical protein